MISIKMFTVNPFQENTYVLYDETKEAVIIDPGFYDEDERTELLDFIGEKQLQPVSLLNTHCHLDHVFGNKFVVDTYKIKLSIHENELPVLKAMPGIAKNYGVFSEESPMPNFFLKEGERIVFGKSELEILLCPGHSPGSICFFNREQKIVIGGDVLFYGSIGRTDLPGGHHATLINSIKNKLFLLDDDYTVYPGHGPKTTIGFERKNNSFLNA